jgi:hypothetical protein
MSTNTYGDFPGVRAEVIGGGVNGIILGEEQKLVVFGRGDTSGSDSADYNDPTRITTRVDANVKFGANTPLAHAIIGALRNGANTEYVYGVMPEQITVGSAELVAGGSGQLNNNPIVEDKSLITVDDVSGATPEEQDVKFVYSSPPPASSTDGEVNINPLTGEVDSGESNDIEVTYDFLDWTTALDSADLVLGPNETGLYCTLSEAESVTTSLQAKVENLRQEYRLVRGVAAAQPNSTNGAGEAVIDPSTYTDGIDNDGVFLAAPTRLANEDALTTIGGIAGLLAGNELTNPVFGDKIRGYTQLVQQLTRAEQDTLRDAKVMPVEDTGVYGDASMYLKDNLSTSAFDNWERDYHRRRIVDQVLLIGRNIGEQAKNQRLTDSLIKFTKQVMLDEIEELVEAGLLEGSVGDEDQDPTQQEDDEEQKPYYVEVTRGGTDTLEVAIGITPVGITKRIDETIVVSDSGSTLSA